MDRHELVKIQNVLTEIGYSLTNEYIEPIDYFQIVYNDKNEIHRVNLKKGILLFEINSMFNIEIAINLIDKKYIIFNHFSCQAWGIDELNEFLIVLPVKLETWLKSIPYDLRLIQESIFSIKNNDRN